jgi:hypothetical protein
MKREEKKKEWILLLEGRKAGNFGLLQQIEGLNYLLM